MAEQATMIQKSIPFSEFKVALQKREFEGYASTFGNVDQVGDIIEPGAFRKTIAERGPKSANKIKLLWEHYLPFGMPLDFSEDTHGLYMRGKAADTQENKDRLAYMAEGVVSDMSIGFSIPEGKAWWEDDDGYYGIRHIQEIKLYEVSAVMFPANELAVVTNVRKQAELHTILKQMDADDLMREVKNMETVDERRLDAALSTLGGLRVEMFGSEEEKRALKFGSEPRHSTPPVQEPHEVPPSDEEASAVNVLKDVWVNHEVKTSLSRLFA